MSVLWNTEKLYREIVGDREMCVKWCEENGLIPVSSVCNEGHLMNLKMTDNFVGYFICAKKHSSGRLIRFTRMRGTVFENRRMPPEKFLCLVHCFVNDISFRNGALECSMDGDTTSKSTVAECYNICRELISHYLLKNSLDATSLGGKNMRVEIIELILEQHKFPSGSFPEGTVVVIMIQQDSNQFVIQPYEDEEFSEENLKQLIKEKVNRGTVIIPHNQRDFSFLSNEGYIILDTGSQKLRMFEKIAKRGVDKLLEHLFKAHMRQYNIDAFEKLIHIIQHYYPV